MNVPFFSNNKISRSISSQWIAGITNVIESQSFIEGDFVQEFEREFATYTDSKYAIGVSNGLDGLVLALRAAGIGTGSVVAVPAHTFIATFLAVIHVGGTPLAIDVDEQGLIDLDKLFQKQQKIDAVIPVHMHGCMVDMQKLVIWSKQRNVTVIEDASQAHGASRDGVKAGQIGDLSVFSLYPTKNLGAIGDAGIVTTSVLQYKEYLQSAKSYGRHIDSKYTHTRLGYNARLDTIHAAVLLVNLKNLDAWNFHRNKLASLYRDLLYDLPLDFLINQKTESVYHHFPILSEDRDELMDFLKRKGIGSEIHYPELASNEIALLANLQFDEVPIASSISARTLSLPLSQWHTEEEVEYVSKQIIEFFKGKN